eukprot:9483993-Pyramimonas_sp.AAC.1
MKFHAFARHIVEQARWAGNPAWSHNYRDESENFATRRRSVGVNRVKFSENSATKWYMQHLQSSSGCAATKKTQDLAGSRGSSGASCGLSGPIGFGASKLLEFPTGS